MASVLLLFMRCPGGNSNSADKWGQNLPLEFIIPYIHFIAISSFWCTSSELIRLPEIYVMHFIIWSVFYTLSWSGLVCVLYPYVQLCWSGLVWSVCVLSTLPHPLHFSACTGEPGNEANGPDSSIACFILIFWIHMFWVGGHTWLAILYVCFYWRLICNSQPEL